MSIAQQMKIAELERRVETLEKLAYDRRIDSIEETVRKLVEDQLKTEQRSTLKIAK